MRILLVEDDPRVASFVARGLREQAFAVDIAEDGRSALFQAFVNPYDAILLDVMIPGEDGFVVCRKIRERGLRVPILMLTARDAVDDRISGLDTGADDYLTKPFAFGELLARLRALLRRGADLRPAVLRVGDLEVDTRGQRAQRGGRSIQLTTKEYALLEFLARHAGEVVGRAAISEHVWDDNFDPFSNTIEVYINRLRRKLSDAGEPAMIFTRRGAGYLLEPAPSTAPPRK
jgi:two-component system copper resistance phosphate regulon response regulator CusR